MNNRKIISEKSFKFIAFAFFIMIFNLNLFAQAINIKGLIIDENSEPLIGASIIIKGTGIGTISDFDGKFELKSVPQNAKLEISYVGYKNRILNVNGKDFHKIQLISDQEMLDEVVVVGYGSMKKRDITGAITSVSAKTIEEKQPITVFDALQGEAPGVLVISNSGAPGDESSVRVRGTSTFEGGVNPLYVVDGVQMDDISALNPNDIESMEILKDAASAAIYGSQSANGVIIITTKKGEKGRIKVNGKYSHSIASLSHKIEQPNSYERAIYESLTASTKKLLLYNPFSDDPNNPTRNGNTDYQDEVTRVAHSDQIDLSISSANETTSFYNSLSYLNNNGVILNSWYKRLSLRSKIEFKPNNKWTFTTNFNYTYTDKNVVNSTSVFNQGLQRPPHFALYFPDGSYIYLNSQQKNPVAEAMMRENRPQTQNFIFNETVKYQFNKYFYAQASVNGNYGVTRTKNFMPSVLVQTGISTASDNTSLKRNYTGEFLLNYNRKFNKSHNVSAMLGSSVQDWYDESLKFAGNGHITESVNTVNAYKELNLASTTTSATSHSMASFFSRLSYNYKSKYLLNFTIRADGSSRFIDNRWGYFPSLSAGWRFSDEKFMKPLKDVLTDAKLRASYGITGNERIGNYDSQVVYTFGSHFYNEESGIRPADRLGNPDLRWEETKQTNLGLDLSFWDGRLKFVFDYYDKITDGLLYNMLLPTELGYSSMRANFGSISNKGFEITVSGDVISNRVFKWNSSANFSYNKNKIIKLGTEDYVADSGWIVAAGQPIGQIYGYKALGVFEYDESNAFTDDFKTRLIPQFERDKNGNVIFDSSGKPTLIGYKYPNGDTFEGTPKQMKYGNTVLKGGDIIWEEQKVDGVIDDEDRKVLGNGMPAYYFSWNNTFTWKKFSLNINFYGSAGNSIVNDYKKKLCGQSTSNITATPYFIYNSWFLPGAVTDVPIFVKTRGSYNQNLGVNSLYVEDGSFIRLKTVRLAYLFTKKDFKWLPVQSLNLWIYGNNLATWTNYSGFDPEFGTSNVLTPGKDSGRFPRNREFGVGLNVNF